jgi:hypothetical protein
MNYPKSELNACLLMDLWSFHVRCSFAFSAIPMNDSGSKPFNADNSTTSARKRTGTAKFRERTDYCEEDPQQYRKEVAGEFKI